MYKQTAIPKTTLQVNKSYEGETIEQKMQRIINNKEPIKDGAPLIYSERKDGVRPEYDIRTDRWEIAIDGMDAVTKSHQAKRDHRLAEAKKKKEPGETPQPDPGKKDGGAEPIQATETK